MLLLMRQKPRAPLRTSPGHQSDRRGQDRTYVGGTRRAPCETTVMELSGFNPMTILDDVDIDYAVRTATFG